MSPHLPGGWRHEESIWQLVECCGYTADLSVWNSLADPRAILDLGCGIGRVSRSIAAPDRTIVGVDRDRLMLEDYDRLVPAGVRSHHGDVLDPWLAPGRFGLVIAPQQLIQIVGGRRERQLLLELVARSLEPDGLAAIAITEGLPRASSRLALTPDIREIEGWVFSSRPVSLVAGDDHVVVERLRQKIAPDGDLTESTDRIRFARTDRDFLRPELERAGLETVDVKEIPPTDAHMASTVLLLRTSLAD